MSTPAGAVAPYQAQAPAVQGVVYSPAVNPDSVTHHKFAQVIHALIEASTAFKDEASKLAAHAQVDSWRKLVIPNADHHRVKHEEDAAPIEDVSLRKAPNSVPVVPAGPAIDYVALAAAIVAQQQAAAAQASAPPAAVSDGTVHDVTSMPSQPSAEQAAQQFQSPFGQ